MAEEYNVQATFTADDSSYVSAMEQVVAANAEVEASAAGLSGAMADAGAGLGGAVSDGASQAADSLVAVGGAMDDIGGQAGDMTSAVEDAGQSFAYTWTSIDEKGRIVQSTMYATTQAAADQAAAANALREQELGLADASASAGSAMEDLQGSASSTGSAMQEAGAGITVIDSSASSAAGSMEEVGGAMKAAGSNAADGAGSITVMGGAMGKVGDAASGASDGMEIFSQSGGMAAAQAGVAATGFSEASDVMESSMAATATAAASTGEESSQSFLQMAWGFGQTVQQAVFMASAFFMVGKVVGDVVGGVIQSGEAAKATAVAYTTFTGSSSAAAEALGQFDAIAQNTSFPTKDMETAGATLLSMGVSSSKAGDELKTVATGLQEVSISSGTALAPAAKALETLRTQSTVTVQSMDQLASTGLPAWQALASGMGTSVDQAMARVKSGAVTGQEAFNDISKGVQNMSGNANAGFDSLQSHVNMFGNAAQSSFGGAGQSFSDLAIMVVDGGTTIVQAVGDFVHSFGGVPVALMPVTAAMNYVANTSGSTGQAMDTLGSQAESTGSATGSAAEPIEKYGSSLQGLGGDLSETASTADTYGSSVKQSAAASSQAGSNIGALGGVLGGVASAFSAAAGAVGQFFSALGNSNSSITGGSMNMAFPGFASGVRNFSGGLAWVGEEGPELVALPNGSSVFPMDDVSGMGFSPLPNITGLASGFGGPVTMQLYIDSALIAQAIAPQLAPTIRLAIGSRK